MKKDSLTSKSITFLLKIGMLYKRDFSLFISLQSSKQNASKTINKLITDGIVCTTSIISNRKNKETEEACYLSKKGKATAIELVENEEIRNNANKYFSKYRTLSPTLLNKYLQENTIKMMFHLCGVSVFACEKPSLINIKNFIVGIQLNENTESPIDKNLSQNIINTYLNKGVYYTSKEYVQFSNSMCPNKADTFYGSRFKGVYVSNTNCLIVYSAERGANKILRINYDKELNLKQSCLDLREFTNIYREIKELFSYKQSKNDPNKLVPARKSKNEPFAIVISDGYSEVYSMATGNPSGLIKSIDFSKVTDLKIAAAQLRAEREKEAIMERNPHSSREIIKTDIGTLFLDGYNKIYEHIFVIPRNYCGVRSLSYLCSNTLESWHKETIEYFKNNPKYFIESDEPFFPYMEKTKEGNILSTYMPVFDATSLRKISNMASTFTIVTHEDMIDTISKSTRKVNRYYDCEFQLNNGNHVAAKLFDSSEFYIYERNGYIKGEWILRSILSQRGLVPIDPNIYSKLSKIAGYDSSIKFYNDVAVGKIDAETIFPLIECKQANTKQPRTKSKSKSQILMTVGKDYKLRILKIANSKNKSVQQYLIKIILPTVDKDYDEYNRNLQAKKKEWKR